MSRAESVVNPPTPGAGRTYSYYWPTFVQPGVSSQPTGDMSYRAVGLATGFQVTNDVAGTVPPVPQGNQGIYRGQQAFQVRADAASLRIFYPVQTTGFPYQMYWPIEKPAATDIPGLDLFACWSVKALLAFDDPPGAVAGDFGLGVLVSNGTTPRGGAQEGFSLSVTNSQTITLTVCQAAGAGESLSVNMVNPPDVRDWNLFEFRMIGATKQSEAQLKVLVNDRIVRNLSWGAGTVLPGMTTNLNNGLGYRWLVGNRGFNAFQTVMYIPPGGVQVSAAPTEADLL